MQQQVKPPVRCHTANSTAEKKSIFYSHNNNNNQNTQQPTRVNITFLTEYSLFYLINFTFLFGKLKFTHSYSHHKWARASVYTLSHFTPAVIGCRNNSISLRLIYIYTRFRQKEMFVDEIPSECSFFVRRCRRRRLLFALVISFVHIFFFNI